MINIQDTQTTLTRMAELLRAGGIGDWAAALERLRHEVHEDPARASATILAMYGGMGSLNDLVLYRDGQPLAQENGELDALRSKLYSLCHE